MISFVQPMGFQMPCSERPKFLTLGKRIYRQDRDIIMLTVHVVWFTQHQQSISSLGTQTVIVIIRNLLWISGLL